MVRVAFIKFLEKGACKKSTIRKRVRLPASAQLKLSARQFEVGNRANFVRINRIGQIWSVKHEQLRFASQILSPTFNSPPDC